jgi:hypothetical protein
MGLYIQPFFFVQSLTLLIGQTGAGKTHGLNKIVLPNAIKHIFDLVDELKAQVKARCSPGPVRKTGSVVGLVFLYLTSHLLALAQHA